VDQCFMHAHLRQQKNVRNIWGRKSWSGETGGNGRSELLIVELHWASVLLHDQFRNGIGERREKREKGSCELNASLVPHRRRMLLRFP
jgi:hypothetical protein